MSPKPVNRSQSTTLVTVSKSSFNLTLKIKLKISKLQPFHHFHFISLLSSLSLLSLFSLFSLASLSLSLSRVRYLPALRFNSLNKSKILLPQFLHEKIVKCNNCNSFIILLSLQNLRGNVEKSAHDKRASLQHDVYQWL
jgi:hypothetical protein